MVSLVPMTILLFKAVPNSLGLFEFVSQINLPAQLLYDFAFLIEIPNVTPSRA